jgi:CBS domain-containing protein
MATMTITLTARDVMNPEVLSVQDDMTVQELAAFLIAHEISGAPVKDRAGKVVGVVSFTDIALATPEDGRLKRVRPEPDFFVRGWEEELEPEEMARLHLVGEGLQVGEIMTPAVYAVEEHTPLGEVARMMREGHLHRLLVLREGTLVGILTTSDLLKVLAEG